LSASGTSRRPGRTAQQTALHRPARRPAHQPPADTALICSRGEAKRLGRRRRRPSSTLARLVNFSLMTPAYPPFILQPLRPSPPWCALCTPGYCTATIEICGTKKIGRLQPTVIILSWRLAKKLGSWLNPLLFEF